MTIAWKNVLGPVLQADAQLQIELSDLESSLNSFPRRCIRTTKRSASSLPFKTQTVAWYPHGHFLVDEVRPGGFLQFAAGDYVIQDAGSMLALALCASTKAVTICDLCAAPGGKSTGLLEQQNGTGLLISNEVIHSRLRPLEQNLQRTGFASYSITNEDPERLVQTLSGFFDLVLVDAPCSGQSMVSKGKQKMAAFSEKQITHSAARQERIALTALQLLKPGGRLVYSTCTFAYQENEGLITRLQEACPQLALEPADHLSRWESPVLPGSYRIWPHREQCGGAFAARLTLTDTLNSKQTPIQTLTTESKRKPANSSDSWTPCGLSIPGVASLTELAVYQRGHRICGFPNQLPDAALPVMTSGIHLADVITSKKNTQRVEPAHGAALLDEAYCRAEHTVDLRSAEAIEYMTGSSVELSRAPEGWTQFTWQQKPIGWAKTSPGKQEKWIAKNHLPKDWRQPKLTEALPPSEG